MGPWIAIVVIVVAVLAVAAVVIARGRRSPVTTAPEPSPAAPPPISSPMTDLESALAKVTDRDGRPIKERIDAESVPSRDPDDTGPLLRRALDSVAHHEVDPTTGPTEPPRPGA